MSELGSAWDALVDLQHVPNPTMASTWLREAAAWEPGVPLLVVVESAQRLLAGAVFGVRRPWRVGGPRLATWLGTRNNWYSPDVLVDPRFPEAGAAVVEAVLRYVDVIEISGPADGLTARTVRRLAPVLDERPATEGWVMPLPPAGLDHASKRAAYELRRATRRGAVIEIMVARRADQMAPVLERTFALHRARWQDDPNAIRRFSSRRADREWYRRTLREMAEEDRVRIVEVTEDGRSVAAVIGLRAGAGAMFHMMAVRRRGHLRQPGHVALLNLVEEAISDGSTVMDLGWGAGAQGSPKARFRPSRIPIVELRGARRGGDLRLAQRGAELRGYQMRGVQLARRGKSVPGRLLSRTSRRSAE